MGVLADHPLAAIFPLMGDADLSALADDIEANGLREPVWLFEDKILDGRNRYRACASKDIDHRVERYKGADPLGFVISKNLHRRHLDESQRAMVAARLANLQTPNMPVRQAVESAAESVSVSPRLVDAARVVEQKAAPELVAAVDKGEVSVSAAAEVAKLPKAEQKRAVAAGTVKEKAKQQRAKKPAQKPAEDPAPAEEPAPAEPAADEGAAFVALVETLCRDTDQIAARMKALKANRFAYAIHVDSAVSQVEAARKTLWQGRPSEPCPYCVANEAAGCKACGMTLRVKAATAQRGREAVGGAK